jgi:general secretion pathway protein H
MDNQAVKVKTPTSATNPRRQQRHWATSQSSQHQRGFTLIELLVVLAIGALLVGLVPVAFGKMQEGSQYRDTVRSMVSELRQARHQAVSLGQPVTYQVDLNQRQFGIQGKPQRPIPRSLEVKTIVGQLDPLPVNGLAQIVFMPQGGSTGGSIEVVRASGAGVRIRVDWLLGQVTQQPRMP